MDRSLTRMFGVQVLNEGYTLNSNYGLMGPAAVASTNEAAHFA